MSEAEKVIWGMRFDMYPSIISTRMGRVFDSVSSLRFPRVTYPDKDIDSEGAKVFMAV